MYRRRVKPWWHWWTQRLRLLFQKVKLIPVLRWDTTVKELNIILHYKIINLMFPIQGFYCRNYGKWMHEEKFYNKGDIINYKYFTKQELSWPCRMIEKERFYFRWGSPRGIKTERKLLQSHGSRVWQGSSVVPAVDGPFGARLSIQTQAALFPVYACAELHILTRSPSAAGFSALPRRFLT